MKQVVTQIQYKDWPDHGVPASTHDIRRLADEVEGLRLSDPNPARPVVVHCSAGVGRTGSFCVIHTIMQQMHRAVKEKDFDPSKFCINLPKTVMMFRSCRSSMVQQVGQYVFCYRAICDEARMLSLIPGLSLFIVVIITRVHTFFFTCSGFFFSQPKKRHRRLRRARVPFQNRWTFSPTFGHSIWRARHATGMTFRVTVCPRCWTRGRRVVSRHLRTITDSCARPVGPFVWMETLLGTAEPLLDATETLLETA